MTSETSVCRGVSGEEWWQHTEPPRDAGSSVAHVKCEGHCHWSAGRRGHG